MLTPGEARPSWMGTSPSVEAWHLWIKFLRRVPVDQWSAQVRKDFDGADEMPVEDFYKDRGMYLFAGPSDELVVAQLLPGDTWDQNRHIALLINPAQPDEVLLELVQRHIWLNRREFKKGRPKFVPGDARYPFCRAPDVNALEITLYLDELKEKHPDWPNWRLLSEAQNHFPVLPRQKLEDDDRDEVAKKKVLNATASRYLARAARIKAGVANGVFPAS